MKKLLFAIMAIFAAVVATAQTQNYVIDVKDFNELLVAKRTVPFAERVGAMKSWADKAIHRASELQISQLGFAR